MGKNKQYELKTIVEELEVSQEEEDSFIESKDSEKKKEKEKENTFKPFSPSKAFFIGCCDTLDEILIADFSSDEDDSSPPINKVEVTWDDFLEGLNKLLNTHPELAVEFVQFFAPIAKKVIDSGNWISLIELKEIELENAMKTLANNPLIKAFSVDVQKTL